MEYCLNEVKKMIHKLNSIQAAVRKGRGRLNEPEQKTLAEEARVFCFGLGDSIKACHYSLLAVGFGGRLRIMAVVLLTSSAWTPSLEQKQLRERWMRKPVRGVAGWLGELGGCNGGGKCRLA